MHRWLLFAMLLWGAVCCSGTPPSAAAIHVGRVLDSSRDSPLVRGVALGDAGVGSQRQADVARAMAAVCAQLTDTRGPGCHLALYLGDNFYPDGVETESDSLFQSHFEQVYGDLALPFWVVLGNHDHGSTSLQRGRGDAQVAYARHSEKWQMPARYYSFDAGPVRFLALDTTSLMLGSLWGDDGQREWLANISTRDDDVPAVIAFGHHPYVSAGRHGMAGNFEGVGWLPIVGGRRLKDSFDEVLCGKVDLYLSGHDHNLQSLTAPCGVSQVVSGAGAKTTPLVHRDALPLRFASDRDEGFVWFQADEQEILLRFFDYKGGELFRETIPLSPRSQ